MTNENQQIHAHADLEIPLTQEMVAEIQKARADHLVGGKGELRFEIEVKKADGRVEKHTLIGSVDGAA